jgi:hypothetical protein
MAVPFSRQFSLVRQRDAVLVGSICVSAAPCAKCQMVWTVYKYRECVVRAKTEQLVGYR